MGGETELLLLRLGLLAIVFAFVLVAAAMLRTGLQPRAARAASRRVVPGQARLVLGSPSRTGYEPGAVFQVAAEASIGRDPGNSIVLPDASVSSHHAQVRLARGWRLVDLGSTNGTLLNGRPVDGRGVALQHGDQVTFGAVVMRFEVS